MSGHFTALWTSAGRGPVAPAAPLCPSCWPGVLREKRPPELCPPDLRPWAPAVTVHRHCPPRRKCHLPSQRHRAQPPGSPSPRPLGLSFPYKVRGAARVVRESSSDLSASSKLSVTGSEGCFLVTVIIVLNFLRGCYQSVTDTLGNGAF